jgi:hypothetical protein
MMDLLRSVSTCERWISLAVGTSVNSLPISVGILNVKNLTRVYKNGIW